MDHECEGPGYETDDSKGYKTYYSPNSERRLDTGEEEAGFVGEHDVACSLG